MNVRKESHFDASSETETYFAYTSRGQRPGKLVNAYPVEPDYQSSSNHLGQVEKTPTRTKVAEKLNRLEKSLIFLFSSLLVLLVVLDLGLQYRNTKMDLMIGQYNQSVNDLKLNSDKLMNELMVQFDYDAVKTAAEEQGLSVDASRIKDVRQ